MDIIWRVHGYVHIVCILPSFLISAKLCKMFARPQRPTGEALQCWKCWKWDSIQKTNDLTHLDRPPNACAGIGIGKLCKLRIEERVAVARLLCGALRYQHLILAWHTCVALLLCIISFLFPFPITPFFILGVCSVVCCAARMGGYRGRLWEAWPVAFACAPCNWQLNKMSLF